MKIIVSADWHLNRQKFPNSTLRQQRGIDAFAKFTENYVSDYDLHVIAGDLFDTPNPSFKLVNSIAAILNSTKTKHIVIQGNHDFKEDALDSPLFTLSTWNDEHVTLINDAQRDNLIFISHHRDPEKWFACLEYNLTRQPYKLKEHSEIYIIAHQWFDCFCDFDVKEMISTDRLCEFLSRWWHDIHIISGHYHRGEEKHYPIEHENVHLYSVGIPLQQSFSDVGCKGIATVIDTDEGSVRYVDLDICDSEFKIASAESNIRECFITDPDNFELNESHFYKVNIDDDYKEAHCKGLIEKGYHIQPNYISQENIPDKLDREQVKKEYTKEDIISETVDELGGGDEKLKGKGVEILNDSEIPF